MTISASATHPCRRSFARLLASVTSLAACVLAATLLGPATAGAVVTEVAGTTVGLQPRNSQSVQDGLLVEPAFGQPFQELQPESFANAAGHPVLHANNTYAIYWDPTATYHGDWQALIDRYLHDFGSESTSAGTVFGVDAQYTDTSNQPAYTRTTFRGAYTDTKPYPASACTDPHPLQESKPHKIKALGCLTDQQMRSELQAFIAAHGLPKGLGTVYYLLTPPGLTVCLDAGGASGHCSDFAASEVEEGEFDPKTVSYQHSFCSYHSAVNPDNVVSGDANTVLYGVIPWTAGGKGDGQLYIKDRTSGVWCQDGGFDPTTRPIEKREKAEKPTVKEEEEFEEKEEEEKAKILLGRSLENPHIQEPNQVGCPSPDGYCDTGLADVIVNQLAVEQQNIVTNPMLNAWQDSGGNEVTDECRNFFAPAQSSSLADEETLAGRLYTQKIGPDNYYINTTFNMAALRLNYPGVFCLPGVTLLPQFTAPSTVNAGDVVSFDGMESDISLNAAVKYVSGSPTANYATYTWNFGDGSTPVSGYAPGAPACETPWLSPCAASALHAYQYGGTYPVTLTVTDVGGNTASETHELVVNGPPPPAPAPEPAPAPTPAPAPAPSVSGSTAPGTTPTTTVVVPPPVAAAAIVSKSLKAVAKKGLVVRYSVNEQVAGRFEVLIPTSVAKRLGISGTPATGLPAGSAPEIVVSKAVLVTTKGGRSTVTIPFSRRTSGRLHRTRKLTLTLRLIVRNAAAHSPASTTVVTAATLAH